MPDGANAYLHLELTRHNTLAEPPDEWELSSAPTHLVSDEIWILFTLLDPQARHPHRGLVTWGTSDGVQVSWGGVSIVQRDGQVNFKEPSFYQNGKLQNSLSLEFDATGNQQIVIYGTFQGGAYVNDCRQPDLGHPILSK